jgi:hypothetical protein
MDLNYKDIEYLAILVKKDIKKDKRYLRHLQYLEYDSESTEYIIKSKMKLLEKLNHNTQAT